MRNEKFKLTFTDISGNGGAEQTLVRLIHNDCENGNHVIGWTYSEDEISFIQHNKEQLLNEILNRINNQTSFE